LIFYSLLHLDGNKILNTINISLFYNDVYHYKLRNICRDSSL
jgi:hypothetical protein